MEKAIYSGDVEEGVYYGSEESKPEFEKSVAERTKMRRHKEPDNEQPDTTNTPDLESEESAEQRRKQKEQGLRILLQIKWLVDH